MIILASSSPRRYELLKTIVDDFRVEPSKVKEKYDSTLSPEKICSYLAKIKGEEVAKRFPNDIILSADTIVVLDNKIYVKPKSINEAIIMLKELSGKTHQVLTGFYIKNKEQIINDYDCSFVTFKKVTESTIKEYLSNNNVLDKAGSYGIQDNQSHLIIQNFSGSLNNIIGLPTEKIAKYLTFAPKL